MIKTLVKSSAPQCPNCKGKGKIQRLIKSKFNIYFCSNCFNGFTYPRPLHIENYYHERYWTSSNILGCFKNFIFYIFQKRRVAWIINSLPGGKILDVGSGEGIFAASLPKTYKVDSLEPPGSKVKNKSIIKMDLLKWTTNKKFDAICFWESLEHMPCPEEYLKKAYKLLNKNGKLFIEFPRFNSLESKLFGKNWFHLDTPRHLAHLTDKGIIILLKRSGFKNAEVKNVASLDYAPWGITASLLNCFKGDTTDYIKKSGNFFLIILLAPLTLLSVIVELILLLISQSPIGLAIAEKNEKT